VEPRDSARLLCVRPNLDQFSHRIFRELPELLAPGDLLVVNETRVSAVRLFGTREQFDGAIEALLLRPAIERGPDIYEALVRPGKKIRLGTRLRFADVGLDAEAVIGPTESGGRYLQFFGSDVAQKLETGGRVPLPPYITATLTNKERYQTVYAKTPGSAAAPTAGLHFTPELLETLKAMGVGIATVCLNVGLGTFRPIQTENIDEHQMHSESYSVPEATANAINACTGRVIAVGTTSLRALESAARLAENNQRVATIASADTDIFIKPGHEFRAIDGLITNFHQPHSTLLLLVAALIGRETMRAAYAEAIAESYRFLSFGDAMLCLK
jgi:S-adenosylmethionine:tRNA ribosyltransferase-isomerase